MLMRDASSVPECKEQQRAARHSVFVAKSEASWKIRVGILIGQICIKKPDPVAATLNGWQRE
jgi:hypothetical protein